MTSSSRAPSASPAGSRRSTLPLIAHLAHALRDADIAYCHWKSNAQIDRSATGENDLDLLIGRGEVSRFTSLVSALGFVGASKRQGAMPGVESFYGYDLGADRFVHVHAHYQLILGHDRTKNYRLPVEHAYIASSEQQDLFRLPSPDFEYIVFVIRMTLKYGIWDEMLWSGVRRQAAGPKSAERDELAFLSAGADPGRTTAILERHLPFIDRELFAACVDVANGRAPITRRARTANRLEARLQPHARHPRAVDLSLRVWRRMSLAARRRTVPPPKPRLDSGGAIIGIMGGDGSGKSTALAELTRWLGEDFDVRPIHLGKPPWSMTTYAVRGGLKAAVAGVGLLERRVDASSARRAADILAAYRPLLWLVCTARDRRLTYRGARRFAIDGGLVLSDRYPHPRLRLMDVPQIARLTRGRMEGRVVEALIRTEEGYHRSIALPEVLILLRLDPEIAVVRKTTEPAESVRARGGEIWAADWTDAGVHLVDADQSKEAVLREIKALIWSALT